MIESKKREPSVEMLNMIYNAFYELTNGKIEILYTREQFLMTEPQQVKEWFEKTYYISLMFVAKLV